MTNSLTCPYCHCALTPIDNGPDPYGDLDAIQQWDCLNPDCPGDVEPQPTSDPFQSFLELLSYIGGF